MDLPCLSYSAIVRGQDGGLTACGTISPNNVMAKAEIRKPASPDVKSAMRMDNCHAKMQSESEWIFCSQEIDQMGFISP